MEVGMEKELGKEWKRKLWLYSREEVVGLL